MNIATAALPAAPEAEATGSAPFRLLSPKEAQHLLGVSATTFWTFVKEGRLNVVRLSERTVRVRSDHLEALIRERTMSGSRHAQLQRLETLIGK